MVPNSDISSMPDVSALFATVGENVRVYPLARIVCPAAVSVGSHVIIDDFAFIGRHRALVIGNHVHIASHASITGGGECICCDFSGISSGARILTGTDRFSTPSLTGPTIPSQFRDALRGRVVIGVHAVVGANAVVMPNVVVGAGAVVGAGSVVTRDLAPWGIYVGAPARRIADRDAAGILELEEQLAAAEGPPSARFRDARALDAILQAP
jgi:acetyltransferase-like isoleucine patch superfamily enzyme